MSTQTSQILSARIEKGFSCHLAWRTATVDRAKIAPPHSSLSLLSESEFSQIVHNLLLYGTYEKMVDRESAYEKFKKKVKQ